MTTTLDSTDSHTEWEKYATLAITGMLFLERIFKNSRFFIKFGPSGLSCGNRTPPTSPAVSRDEESPPDTSTPLDTTELEEFREYKRKKQKRQAKKARAKQLNYNKSHDSAEDSP